MYVLIFSSLLLASSLSFASEDDFARARKPEVAELRPGNWSKNPSEWECQGQHGPGEELEFTLVFNQFPKFLFQAPFLGMNFWSVDVRDAQEVYEDQKNYPDQLVVEAAKKNHKKIPARYGLRIDERGQLLYQFTSSRKEDYGTIYGHGVCRL